MNWPGSVFLVLSLAMLGQALTPSSFFSTVDKQRLSKVFQSSLQDESLSSLHYAILGYGLLGETAPNSQDLCKKLESKMSGSVSNVYQAATAGAALKCSFKPSADVNTLLTNALSADSSVSDIYSSVMAQRALGSKLDSATIYKALNAGIKKDDSITNLGYAFQIASVVDGADAKGIFDRIEDAIVQADEVDEKMLQFEGGLSVTNLIVSGAYRLCEKLNKSPAITKQQAVQFANYFLSRKSVQSAKGGFHLLEALTSLTSNKFHIPVAITLSGPTTVVSESNPNVQIMVTDLFGKGLGKMEVTIDSAMRQSDGAVIMAKSKMSLAAGGDGSTYEVNMLKAKPGRGFYELTVSAAPSKADERLVGNSGAALQVKSLGSVVITGAEIGIGDADQTTAPKMNGIDHPKKLSKALEADHHHKVIFKFSLEDKTSNEKIRVHQAFVRLSHAKSGSEIIFVAEPDSNQVYKFDLDVSAKAKEFGGKSGKYEIHLIVGDAVISNPVSWYLADLSLTFPESAAVDEPAPTGPKPEIRHLFREPEKRPSAFVSNLFTLLCLAPILVMLIFWLSVGVNMSSFPFSLPAIGFHLGLGAIFTLYYYFWLQLNMFTTMKYLIMVGVVTFLCGNKMLVKIAEKRN